MSLDPNYNEWANCKHDGEDLLKCAGCGVRCCPQCSWEVDRECGEAIACADCVTHGDLDADLKRMRELREKAKKVTA